jgi:hypothetical protein
MVTGTMVATQRGSRKVRVWMTMNAGYDDTQGYGEVYDDLGCDFGDPYCYGGDGNETVYDYGCGSDTLGDHGGGDDYGGGLEVGIDWCDGAPAEWLVPRVVA